ncbi:uncharacterized protein LOC126481835 [Schistocerca serialis cubense]|uniref:uncharacterized protein LOC126481835 n=1 Tax=Schistocerca serialis cubense TaxID=2023355 RepID=UPI00214E43C9|nr:uncharacterized protein LOC126481835 [Schistocerca serialis cubense]
MLRLVIELTMGRYYKRKTQKAKWMQEELCKALDAIKSGRKIREVSRAFGIHEATLRTRMKYAEANNIANNFDKSSRLAGKDWLALFLKRNPSISLRKPEATSIIRIQAFNEEEVNAYFKNLERVFEKYKFKEGRVFNVVETGINTVQKPDRILAPKGVKQIVLLVPTPPPTFIFPRKRMSNLLSKGGPVGAIYGCSVNGSSNESLFFEWIQHFQNNVKSTIDDPVLLILDNHSSHMSLDIFEFCKKHSIVMVTIPPHTSHKLQPLDVTFFSSLKLVFSRECDMYMKSQVYHKITPYELAELFNKAYNKVTTMDNGQSGFKACGICPFNPNKFQRDDLQQCEIFRDVVLEDEEVPNARNGNEVVASTNEPHIPKRSQERILESSAEDVPLLVGLEEVTTTSTKSACVKHTKQAKGKPKGKSVILTATPEKNKLLTELSIKKQKEAMKKKAEGNKKRNRKDKADKCRNLQLKSLKEEIDIV